MPTTRQDRLEWVDIAKAIGIILVVYGHVARGLQTADIGIPENVFIILDKAIYSFHMPLFFFLSGLFLNSSITKAGPQKLLESKVDTIIYPYIIWSLIQGGIEVLSSEIKNTQTSTAEILSLPWNPRAQFWFLYILALIFALACAINPTRSKSRSIFFSAIAILPYFTPRPGIYILDLAAENLIFFYMGSKLLESNLISELKSTRAALATAALAGTLHLLNTNATLTFMQSKASQLALATASIAFIISISQKTSKHNPKLLLHIGKHSMPIYLMHIIYSSGIRTILEKVADISNPATHILLGTIAGIAAPLYTDKLIRDRKIRLLYSAPLSELIISSARRLRQK